jgi:hypothetical protein
MEGYFFKQRKNLDIKPNKYDLGTPYRQSSSHLDKFFLNKIDEIDISEYQDLYDYHKTYYLSTYPGAEEKIFFENTYSLVLKDMSREYHRDPIEMSPRQKNNSERYIKGYKNFTEMMKFKDNWNIISNEKEDIYNISKNLEKDYEYKVALRNEIKSLNEELAKSRSDNQKLREKYNAIAVSPQKKVVVKELHFATLVNLISELKEVESPEFLESKDDTSKNFFITKKRCESTWVKLIVNNFSLEGKEIKSTRVENYFKKTTSERVSPKKANQCKVEISTKKV